MKIIKTVNSINKPKLLLILPALAMLVGCNGEMKPAEVNPIPHDTYRGEGLFSGKDGNILDAFKSGGKASSSEISSATIGVNLHLWRASLEALSFMPISQADSAGGVIITDWYANPNETNERVKINVYLLSKILSSQAVKVSVFKQVKSKNGEWKATKVSKTTASQLEDTILSKARAMKIKANAVK